MSFTNKKIIKILEHYKTIWALNYAAGLAQWDLNTYMPPDGAPARGEAMAKLSTLCQKLFLDRKFMALIEKAGEEKKLSDAEKGVARTLKKDLRNYQKLPPEFLEEFERVTSEAHVAWRESKQSSDFSRFAPFLERIVDLNRRKADYLGYEGHPYDALINEFEEGWTTKDLDDFFSGFRSGLKEILDQVLSRPGYSPSAPLAEMPYNRAAMERVNREILDYLRVDPRRLRLDASPHPFTQGLTNRDVRITTWYAAKDFGASVSSTIHEFGHALYEAQVGDALQFTPIGGGRSLGLHESQSRFWENMVGRSRAFAEKFMKSFQGLSTEIDEYLEKEGVEGVHRYFNLVKPGLIRVEADEVTYHFHVILRFYLEKSLLEGTAKVRDLPEIWNQSMERFLGVAPKNDAEGVLQDIHWSMGAMGYFPTYSIGTFLSAMWREAMEEEFGDLDEFLLREEAVERIQKWLREKVHRHGAAYTLKDLVKRSIGKDFSTEPMLKYLRKKYLANDF
ncbi:MAG: carboxypeptidase M32 [Nitrospinae bacterium]|nr:carboxypeptidase M32 [Nitrospinota bacterium]